MLVEGVHPESDLLIVGRHASQAPDIDGIVIINDLGNKEVQAGDIIPVTISEVNQYDLVGGHSPL